MSTIIVVLSLLWPSPPGLGTADESVQTDEIRYRGIEALLARFEAEALAHADQNL